MVSKSLKSTIKTGKLENLKSENYPSLFFDFGLCEREFSYKLYSVKMYMLTNFTEEHWEHIQNI